MIALGSADFKVDLAVLRRNLLDNGFEDIAINSSHASAVDTLPPIHKDPFDRMLIVQTAVEEITLTTADIVVAGILWLWLEFNYAAVLQCCLSGLRQ